MPVIQPDAEAYARLKFPSVFARMDAHLAARTAP